jgi:hypothetical protein
MIDEGRSVCQVHSDLKSEVSLFPAYLSSSIAGFPDDKPTSVAGLE